MDSWHCIKNILCIRPDNMGDLVMSGPAIRALKESFDAKITVLTSSMAALIAKSITEIDEIVIFDAPWVKTILVPDREEITACIEKLQRHKFDAAIIFTVYSQNPLPSAMMAYMAKIPRVLAYCRENPYGLITDWVPDQEPYKCIKHQVQRDLDLVRAIGANPFSENLQLTVDHQLSADIVPKLIAAGVEIDKPWLILHPGVSETKRRYPFDKWIRAAKMIIDDLRYQVLITGSSVEQDFAQKLQNSIGERSFSVAGMFSLDELICLIAKAPVMLSVNTGTVHIAAATGTPVVVLYAQTNPQHKPWQALYEVLEFSIEKHQQSKNEVIAYVNEKLYSEYKPMPDAAEIVKSIRNLLNHQPRSFQWSHEALPESPDQQAS